MSIQELRSLNNFIKITKISSSRFTPVFTLSLSLITRNCTSLHQFAAAFLRQEHEIETLNQQLLSLILYKSIEPGLGEPWGHRIDELGLGLCVILRSDGTQVYRAALTYLFHSFHSRSGIPFLQEEFNTRVA